MARRSLTALFLALMTGSVMGANGFERRSAQTTVACQGDFGWMDNNKNLSPCLIAAYVEGACSTENWIIYPLNASNSYTAPNDTTRNPCSCSWASYNLLAGCTVCQGFSDAAVLAWSAYQNGCGTALISTTDYFPKDTLLPDNVTLPFWASQNPATWTNAKFDRSQAESFSGTSHPDVSAGVAQAQSEPPAHKKSIAGPVAGGVVGAIAILAIAAGVYFYSRKKKPHRKIHENNQLESRTIFSDVSSQRPGYHLRSTSDLSTSSKYMYPNVVGDLGAMMNQGQSSQTGRPMMTAFPSDRSHVRSPDMSSVNSLSLPYTASPNNRVPRAPELHEATPRIGGAPNRPENAHTMSSSSLGTVTSQTHENIISPFTGRNNGEFTTNPISPIEEEDSPRHTRRNPPAYTRGDSGDDSTRVMRGPPPTHGAKRSVDTVTTTSDITLSGHAEPISPSSPTSISGVTNLLGHIGHLAHLDLGSVDSSSSRGDRPGGSDALPSSPTAGPGSRYLGSGTAQSSFGDRARRLANRPEKQPEI